MLSKVTLFLSSTQIDLIEYRKVVSHVGYRLGMDVVAMEDFGPDSSTPLELCRERVRSADVLVGLYAHRYGFQPPGGDGKSLTELEYEWAVEAGLEILIFIIDEDQLWSPRMIDDGDSKQRLNRLKARLRLSHAVAELTTPERLRSDLFQFLPKLNLSSDPSGSTPKRSVLSVIPTAPNPYIAHTYTLLQTKDLVGRERELRLLDAWVSDPESELYDVRELCLVAIGGMGKSALTWKWFNQHAPNVATDLAGRMWWSFYENDAGFQPFVTSALAYCTGRDPKEIAESLSIGEQETALLAILDRDPYLLVLDGAERLLLAYAGMDFAHLTDDELDTRTANVVAGMLGLDAAEAEGMIAQHRLRKTIDPHAGIFLKKLANVRSSRVLITTRLYPSALQTVTGEAIPGCQAVFLRGLDPGDAQRLWREMGVSGSDDELDALFKTFDYYPLLIRALAGEVARHRAAPGNFDVWRRMYPDFDPYQLPLVQVKSHVLAHALKGLSGRARDLLHTIAAFRAPVPYETIAALFAGTTEGELPKSRGWTDQELDAELSELEDRSLVGWDRVANSYDLHPIVRGVVWAGVPDVQRREVHDSLRAHFEAVPEIDDEEITVTQAKPVLELFNSLVALERYKEASDLYFDRINHKVDFWSDGSTWMKIVMLKGLFPDGLETLPPDVNVVSYAQLGHASRQSSDFEQALRSYVFCANGVDSSNKWLLCSFVAKVCKLLGLLKHASCFSEASIHFETLEEYFEADMALFEAMVGHSDDALRRLQALKSKESEHFKVRNYLSRVHLLRHHWEGADQEDLPLQVRARAWLGMGMSDRVIQAVTPLLLESRQKSWHSEEIDTSCILAEAHRKQGNLDYARQLLIDSRELAERGPYRLALAEGYNILAEIERDAGHPKAATEAAVEAFRQAWCDGPPFSNHLELEKAKRLLKEFGAAEPEPPLPDTRFDELLAQVDLEEGREKP